MKNVYYLMLVILTVHRLEAQNLNDKKPNFIIIVTDDQDAKTLDVYGDQSCDTPEIDKLSKKGMTFHSAYHMGSYRAAVCTPSRIMLMTGRFLWETTGFNVNYPPLNYVHKAAENYAKISPADPAYFSLPAIFKRNGYYTFRTSKRGNSYEGANLLFEERYDKKNREADPENGSKWHADKVIKYLEKRKTKQESQPFLIYLGFSHPHDPRHGRPELLKKYGAIDPGPPDIVNKRAPKLPINYLPKHPFPIGHPDLRDKNEVEGVMQRRDEATIRNEKGKEFAVIEEIDNQIGRVIKRLKSSGELDNTYIIFTSDHGIAVGKHGLMGKQNLYQHSLKVPFIVSGPNVEKQSSSKGNIYLLDLLPTLCDLANIEIPDSVDGKSFKQVLFGEQQTIRDVLYGAYSGGTKPGIRAVIKGDWKLIKYDVLEGKVRKNQLFNIKENPNELLLEHHQQGIIQLTGNKPSSNQINLAEDPKYSDKLKEMEKLLFSEMEKVGDPFRFWNQN